MPLVRLPLFYLILNSEINVCLPIGRNFLKEISPKNCVSYFLIKEIPIKPSVLAIEPRESSMGKQVSVTILRNLVPGGAFSFIRHLYYRPINNNFTV